MIQIEIEGVCQTQSGFSLSLSLIGKEPGEFVGRLLECLWVKRAESDLSGAAAQVQTADRRRDKVSRQIQRTTAFRPRRNRDMERELIGGELQRI